MVRGGNNVAATHGPRDTRGQVVVHRKDADPLLRVHVPPADVAPQWHVDQAAVCKETDRERERGQGERKRCMIGNNSKQRQLEVSKEEASMSGTQTGGATV